MRWRSYTRRRKRPGEESAIPWRGRRIRSLMAPPQKRLRARLRPSPETFCSCKRAAVFGRVSRTGVTRHRSPSSDYATLIRPTTTGEAAKIALTLPSPRGRGTKECAIAMAPPQGACGRGCAPVPKSVGGRGLSERSEFRSPNLSGLGQRHPKGWNELPSIRHARAPMVLGPFAETKGPRRAGPKPRKTLPFWRAGPNCNPPLSRNPAFFTFPFCHPRQL